MTSKLEQLNEIFEKLKDMQYAERERISNPYNLIILMMLEDSDQKFCLDTAKAAIETAIHKARHSTK